MHESLNGFIQTFEALLVSSRANSRTTTPHLQWQQHLSLSTTGSPEFPMHGNIRSIAKNSIARSIDGIARHPCHSALVNFRIQRPSLSLYDSFTSLPLTGQEYALPQRATPSAFVLRCFGSAIRAEDFKVHSGVPASL